MKILFWSPDYKENFECEVENLLQLLDFCKTNKPELHSKLLAGSYTYTVYKEDIKKAYPLLPDMLTCGISSYDNLIIAPKVSGGVSAIAAGLAYAGLATWAAYAVAVVVVIGAIIALGYLIQALTPNKKLTGEVDPAEASRLFNGVPNIVEQGGSVPVVTGNCLFGGVRIGLKFEPTRQAYTDVTYAYTFAEAMTYPSTWIKLI